MASSLQGKVVVVTGASSGLGRQTAIKFARHGSEVVLAARREAALEETARRCREDGGVAHVVPTDVTNEVEVERLVDDTLARTGRIDVWVNNAGVTLFAALWEARSASTAEWSKPTCSGRCCAPAQWCRYSNASGAAC